MKCINCYREIADGLKFCPKCGTMQPKDREAYELEHPELADAIPEEELFEQLVAVTEPAEAQQSENASDMMSSQATDAWGGGVTASAQEATQQAANYVPPQVGPVPLGAIECPICHNPIAYGTSTCPHCKQLLDWGDGTSQQGSSSPKKGNKSLGWILLVVALIAAVAVAGYFIFGKSGKKKHHSGSGGSDSSSYVDSTAVGYGTEQNPGMDPNVPDANPPQISVEEGGGFVDEVDDFQHTDGPTGDARKDARVVVEKILSILEGVNNRGDVINASSVIMNIGNEYKNFYENRGRIDEFKREVMKIGEEPAFRERLENAERRLREIGIRDYNY